MSTVAWAGGTAAERIGCRLAFGDDGRLLGLARTSGERIVTGLGPVGAVVDGAAVAPSGVRARVSDDEVEQEADLGPLRLRVRHNLDRTWQVRLQVTNPTDARVRVDRLGLEATPGPDARVLVLGAGAEATIAFCQVRGPVLGLRTARGELVVDDEGLTAPPLVLGPEESWTVTLHGQWYPSRVALWAGLPAWFPPAAIDELELADFAIDHPDAAVTRTGGEHGGTMRVAVADAGGTTVAEVAVAREAADEVARVVTAVVARGRVADAAEAVVLAVGASVVEPARVAELLADYAERTPDGPSPLQACLWARLAMAGQPQMFERALDCAARLEPGPGTGLAAVALWTAAALAGVDTPELGHRLARLADRDVPPGDPVTLVELAGLAGRRDGYVPAAEWELELLCHAAPGELWPRRPDAELARAVAVRTLAQDPCTDLVRRLLARCADRADATENAPVLAWLGLGGL